MLVAETHLFTESAAMEVSSGAARCTVAGRAGESQQVPLSFSHKKMKNKTKQKTGKEEEKTPQNPKYVNPNLFVKEGCASKHWLPASGL